MGLREATGLPPEVPSVLEHIVVARVLAPASLRADLILVDDRFSENHLFPCARNEFALSSLLIYRPVII